MRLNDREWKEFPISGKEGVFDITSSSSGIDKNKLLFSDKKRMIPYITRSEDNNGINLFINIKQQDKYLIDESNVITIGLDTQTVFYQSHRFYTGQNIQVLRHSKLNKYNALFLIPLLRIQMEKFNWGGNGATLGRLAKTKIMLPIDDNKEPDFDYMKRYIKKKEEKEFLKYKKYIQDRIKKTNKLTTPEWGEFEIKDIFNIFSGKRLTKPNMEVGKIPFIGAIDSNNGITEYVSNINKSIDKNVLGVNYNGSVVENFYHPYEALFSDDVKRFSFKHRKGNKYLYLFVKQVILMQKEKYQYGYKFNEKRMERQKIMLPITEYREVDYMYMENFMKNLMYEKLNQFSNRL